MPLPFIAIISALASGGTLVSHTTGGLIVTGAGGYIPGTFLSTAAIKGLLASAILRTGVWSLASVSGVSSAVSAGVSGAVSGVSGAAATVIGSAGIFGTTVGASGITGALMSAGIIASTPVWIPIALTGATLATLGCGYGGYRFLRLKKKLAQTPAGEEAKFSKTEAKIIEKIINRLAKKNNADPEGAA